MLPSIIVCCCNLIFYVLDNQLQPTSSHQLKYKWKNYHKKTRTGHHKGIKKKSSLSTITIKWNILHNNRIPASRSPNFFTWTNFQRIYTRVLGWDFHLHQDYILTNFIKCLTSYLHQILKNLSRKQNNWKTIILIIEAYPPTST